jgi:hypothetical protein
MRIRILITVAAVLAVLMPAAAQASYGRHCGAIRVGATPFQVFAEHGRVSCAGARAVMAALYRGHHREVCFRSEASDCRNGRPTDRANTVILVGSWRCGTGAGGGSCSRPKERISAFYIESAAEKRSRAKREAEENHATVTRCENSSHMVLMQEGSAPNYIYECISEEKLAEECENGVCREPMYSQAEAERKWAARVAEACQAIGDQATGATRAAAGIKEYECAPAEGSGARVWVSLAYLAPEEYAELPT